MNKLIKVLGLMSLLVNFNLNAEDKELEPIDKLNKCKEILKNHERNFKIYIDGYYFQNDKEEQNVLSFYHQLKNNKDINLSSLPEARQKRLYENENFLSYYNSLIKEYDSIYEDFIRSRLSKDDFERQFKALMFAFAIPYEILSTKSIYNKSLFDFTQKLYNNLTIKNSLNEYTNSIYALIPHEFNIIKEKYLSNTLNSSVKDIENYCISNYNDDLVEDINDTTNSIFTEINENFLHEDNSKYPSKAIDLNKRSIIFDNYNTKYDKEIRQDLITDPLQNSWYVMVRKYISLQDKVLGNESENSSVIKKIDSIIIKLNEKGNIKVASNLKLLLDEKVKLLIRKMMPLVRYNIFDLPVSIYSDIYLIKYNNAKGYFNDNENEFKKIALLYNKSIAALDKNIISDFAKLKTRKLLTSLKGEFGTTIGPDGIEWIDVVNRAKMDQNWLDQLNKIKIDDAGKK